jgi:hypothetical protein
MAGPTYRGPAQCKHSPWTIKGRVHSLDRDGHIPRTHTQEQAQAKLQAGLHNQYNTKVDIGYYAPAARTTLNLCVLPALICPPIERS